MNSAISTRCGCGLFVNHDADLDSLFELGEVEDPADGRVEGAFGLDDVVVECRLRAVERDADHQVRVVDPGPGEGEVEVAEAAAVREHVHAGVREQVAAEAQKLDQLIAVEGRFAAGEADLARVGRQEPDELEGVVEQPSSLAFFGGCEHIRQ